MNTLLTSLYDLLSFITEDAQSYSIPGTDRIPRPVYDAMNNLMTELEKHLHN